MNVARVISEVRRQKGEQPIGILFKGKLYDLIPCLDEVKVNGVKYVALIAGAVIGEPTDEPEEFIFNKPKVIPFSNSEQAVGDARDGHYIVLNDKLDYEPGARCMAVLTYNNDDDERVYVVHVYIEENNPSLAEISYNDTGWRKHKIYTYAPIDDLDATERLFKFCELTPIQV
jgi:hypothetical protein